VVSAECRSRVSADQSAINPEVVSRTAELIGESNGPLKRRVTPSSGASVHLVQLTSLAELGSTTGASKAVTNDRVETRIGAEILARDRYEPNDQNVISRGSSTGSRSGASKSATAVELMS